VNGIDSIQLPFHVAEAISGTGAAVCRCPRPAGELHRLQGADCIAGLPPIEAGSRAPFAGRSARAGTLGSEPPGTLVGRADVPLGDHLSAKLEVAELVRESATLFVERSPEHDALRALLVELAVDRFNLAVVGHCLASGERTTSRDRMLSPAMESRRGDPPVGP